MSPDMRELDPAGLAAAAAEHPYPLVFATVSGAHLYGFPSRDSDVDLRGAHLLPLAELVGLRHGPETVERSWQRAVAGGRAEFDLVTHDAAKFLRLLLRPNGYVLEQLLSPLVVVTGPAHADLIALAPDCLTRRHAYHYRGFAQSSAKLHSRSGELKPLLYAFRVLLTGIHLLSAGELEADLRVLAELVPGAPAYLPELMAAKADHEHGPPPDVVPAETTSADLAALHERLDAAERASPLPDEPSAGPALHELLVRLRLGAG